jgi:Calcineurin-like phosphoesterase.
VAGWGAFAAAALNLKEVRKFVGPQQKAGISAPTVAGVAVILSVAALVFGANPALAGILPLLANVDVEFGEAEGDDASTEDKIGFAYKEIPEERIIQDKALLREIDKELALPGTGKLPLIAIISDYHGDCARFAAILSDVLNRLCGFKGQIDPNMSIEEQLNLQRLSLKTMNGAIYLNGDLLDRGKYGMKCFKMARELIETAPDRVFYVSGNHDFWAFGNLLGIHLPWYTGFNFYTDSPVPAFAEFNRRAQDLVEEQRKNQP